MPGPTGHDVARAAGLSQATVSRALRGDPRISAPTRRHIREVAERLGYVADQRGRNLSKRTTGQVGVVVGDLANIFYMEAIEHLHGALAATGRRAVVLTDTPEQPLDPDALLDGSVDAAILLTVTRESPVPVNLAERGLATVLMNRTVDRSDLDLCASTNVEGAAAVADLLVQLGHQRVGALLGPQDTSTGAERERGFRERMADHGAPVGDTMVFRGSFSYEAGFAGLLALHAAANASAVFCANDVIALGAINAARELGLEIPRDLTVVGFDDIAMAAWPVFALSTVRQDLGEMAREATRMVVDRLVDPSRPHQRSLVATTFMPRGTHAPPR